MAEIDVGAIVPSTRDLLQVVSTRRRSLALVAEVGPDRPGEEAARLYDMNLSAFAFAEPGEAMQLGARSTKTVPTLCLLAAGSRDALLAARYYGADGVCIDAALPPDEWEKLAKIARTMRMLPLALASSAGTMQAAMQAGARALLVRAPSAAEVVTLADGVARSLILVGHVTDAADQAAGASALRELAGHVDAAVVPQSVHVAPGFAGLVSELDP
jgi:hypothetical protein